MAVPVHKLSVSLVILSQLIFGVGAAAEDRKNP